MYKDFLLDHYRNPHNYGNLKKKTHSASVYNSLCGDRVQLDILISKGKILDIAFAGEGCVISTASASLLTDYLKNKSVAELNNLTGKSMIDLIGIEVSPGRIKCLLLPYEALKKALK